MCFLVRRVGKTECAHPTYLEKFFNKKYIITILSLALLIDCIFIYMWHKFNFYIQLFYILSLGGVFICYLSLIVWFGITKKYNKQ